jgi:hypothetical protein
MQYSMQEHQPKMLANLETQQQSLNPKNAIKLKKAKLNLAN